MMLDACRQCRDVGARSWLCRMDRTAEFGRCFWIPVDGYFYLMQHWCSGEVSVLVFHGISMCSTSSVQPILSSNQHQYVVADSHMFHNYCKYTRHGCLPSQHCFGCFASSTRHYEWTPLSWPSQCTGWWFGTFSIFPYIRNNHPNWLIFFRGVETTNHRNHEPITQ